MTRFPSCRRLSPRCKSYSWGLLAPWSSHEVCRKGKRYKGLASPQSPTEGRPWVIYMCPPPGLAQHRHLTKAVNKCGPGHALPLGLTHPTGFLAGHKGLSPSQFPHLFQESFEVNDTLGEGGKEASFLEIETAIILFFSVFIYEIQRGRGEGFQWSPSPPATSMCHLLETDTQNRTFFRWSAGGVGKRGSPL